MSAIVQVDTAVAYVFLVLQRWHRDKTWWHATENASV
jgi:hypothetical protein